MRTETLYLAPADVGAVALCASIHYQGAHMGLGFRVPAEGNPEAGVFFIETPLRLQVGFPWEGVREPALKGKGWPTSCEALERLILRIERELDEAIAQALEQPALARAAREAAASFDAPPFCRPLWVGARGVSVRPFPESPLAAFWSREAPDWAPLFDENVFFGGGDGLRIDFPEPHLFASRVFQEQVSRALGLLRFWLEAERRLAAKLGLAPRPKGELLPGIPLALPQVPVRPAEKGGRPPLSAETLKQTVRVLLELRRRFPNASEVQLRKKAAPALNCSAWTVRHRLEEAYSRFYPEAEGAPTDPESLEELLGRIERGEEADLF
ncbi:hypothetical protein [Rhodothermus marinus]|uniref:Uncharacterized protein n=1 Tax=Rhodothermus marinus (strain ATCC 43812 / DSM 4252 / R-10) TaxID=518766 RepID=D0MK58_RHOM4|nr:hypothetical protein [Rhodothermus marinus]ACY46971.1 hypothetical protein Rmar_0062 [Rhodothermus marinus DSM 4252]